MTEKTRYPTEQQEQVAFVRWMRRNGIPHFAVPNGGLRRSKTAGSLRSAGVVKGVPDLFVCVSLAKAPHGVWIEMKRQGSRASDVSPDQRQWIANLRAVGHAAEVAAGCEDAKRILVEAYGVTVFDLDAQGRRKP